MAKADIKLISDFALETKQAKLEDKITELELELIAVKAEVDRRANTTLTPEDASELLGVPTNYIRG